MELSKAERIIRHEIRFVEYEGPESIDEIIRLFGWKRPDDPGDGLDPIRHSGDDLWYIIKSDYERVSLERGRGQWPKRISRSSWASTITWPGPE